MMILMKIIIEPSIARLSVNLFKVFDGVLEEEDIG